MNTALLIGASGVTVGRGVTVGATGATTTLGGNFTSGTSSFTGGFALGKTVNLAADGTSTVNFNGALSGTGGFNKTGTGTVSLGGGTQNSSTGNIDIKAGTLQLAKTTGGFDVLGATQGAIGDLAAVTLSGTSSVLSIGGPSGQTLEEIGSLSGVAGSNVNVAQATAFTLYTGNNNNTTTFAGTLTDTGGNLSLVKQGTGTMTLTGANSYDGTTTVQGGTLIAANNTALGNATGNTTVNVGATLGLQGGITITGEQMNLAGTGVPIANSLIGLTGANTSTGNITLTGAANDTVRMGAAAGSQLTLGGVISETGGAKILAKTGDGTLVLSGANTYTGLTNVTAGTLVAANNSALGTTAGATSVQAGATLAFQNNVSIAAGEAITLQNAFSPTAPSLKNNQDNNTVAGAITIAGSNNAGVIIDSNSGNLTLNGVISQTPTGAFVTKTGGGTLTLSGIAANTFTGAFSINDGTVIANKTAGQNATGTGSIFIGDGTGAASSAVLQLGASDQLNNTSALSIATDGRLDLQANSDTVGAVTMAGGSIIGSGTVTLGGNLTFNGVGASTATISSGLNLGGNRTIQVGNNGSNADNDLSISGVISGTGNLTKTDLGVLAISGTAANTYTGTTAINDGTVTLNKTAGVQALGGSNVTVGDGVGLASTANLKLLASNQILDSTSVAAASDGKLDLNGFTETIASFTGTGLIDTGAATGKLTAGGTNASWTYSGSLAGAGSIDKVGSGTLTFDQTINFTSGTLNLVGGTLALAGISFNVGTLNITGNTTIDFGNSAATFLTANNVYIAPGANLTILNWVNGVDYFYALNNFSSVSGGTNVAFDTRPTPVANQVTFTSPTLYSDNQTAWQSYDRQITPVPEPSTYGAIFIGACVGLIYWRRRRAKSE